MTHEAPLVPPAARRPRILFFSTVYPTPWEPNKGAANRSTVAALRELNCEVRVVAPVPWPVRRRGARSAPAPIERYPTWWYPSLILRTIYHHTMWWSSRRALDAVTRQFRPDAVLAFWAHPDGAVALRFARARGIPMALIVGGSDVMLLPGNRARRRVVADVVAGADHVFAVGSVLVRRCLELGARPEHTSNFLCGVDPAVFTPGDRRDARARLGIDDRFPLLLWIGQMVGVKAIDRLLDATEQLARAFPDVTVALVGDGPERSRLEQRVAASATLRDRVKFAGGVEHQALPDWYRAADLFVLPSRSEGVPTVLLEAMACGLPFVASDVGSIADLLPFGPSRVTPEGDIAALTTAISTALRATPGLAVAPRVIDRLEATREMLTHLLPGAA